MEYLNKVFGVKFENMSYDHLYAPDMDRDYSGFIKFFV